MKKISVWVIVFLFFGNVLAWAAVWDLWGHKFLEVNFLDVGQGDAAFIETPGSLQILIDGGPSSAILEKLGNKMPFWDRSIDLIILSHPEKDHLAGLIEVLKRYKVENILWTGIVRDTAEYREWSRLIREEGARVVIAQAGQIIKIGKIEIDILNPLENLSGQELEDSNDSSVVAKLIYGQDSFLFTGDISSKTEEKIISDSADIDIDVLKISHHGSKYSSTGGFIKAVSPEIAVIEVGKDNSYGHPAQEVLDRLINYGIDILRTDISGDIKIISDSKNIWQTQ
jgi:competence protein ComEC